MGEAINNVGDHHFLTMESINPRAIEMEYAVRGPIVTRSVSLMKELASGVQKPFDSVLQANIGDCHATGQKPITFIRQVIAMLSYPKLLESDMFPDDAKEHARRILDGCKGKSAGSYRYIQSSNNWKTKIEQTRRRDRVHI